MIPRYTKSEMAAVWTEQAKFGHWVQSVLAVLSTLARRGEIDPITFTQIAEKVTFDLARVHELDRKFNHDAQALIEAAKESLVREGLSEKAVALFGMKITSYDMEDPAFSTMIGQALNLIEAAIDQTTKVLKRRMYEFRDTLCIFQTHGQAAVPGYLGIKFARWVAMLERDKARLHHCRERVRVGKFSGAGGVYDELSPEIEVEACAYLGLGIADGTSQIIHRDRHAEVMCVLAICGCDIAQIANELWLMCSYPRSEAREYFDPNQRGSSAMPHKRNPITLERLRGMSSLPRSYAMAALEQVMTYDERAIDQSCVERVIWPDATILLHYMLVTLEATVDRMVFFPERMKENFRNLQGIWAAQYVKNELLMAGVTELPFTHPDGQVEVLPTYKWVQACAFAAWDVDTNRPIRPLREVLLDQGILQFLPTQKFEECFDLKMILRYAEAIYLRYYPISHPS